MRLFLYKILFLCALLCSFVAPVAAQIKVSADTLKTYTMRGTYYSDRFVGRKTSSGEVFTQDKYTAAHNTFRFGTLLLVTNTNNNKQVIVRVNDRCPKSNIVDMTRKAARQINIGSLHVQVQVLPESFYPYWEAQDQLIEVMSNGEFLTYAASNPPPKASASSKLAANNSANDSKKTAKTSDDKKNNQSHASDVVVRQLYDIELCRCASRNTAKKLVEQLPIYYQNSIEYESLVGNNEVIVFLRVSMKKEKAEEVLDEVTGMFPDAKIVKSNL
ncbi:MAG: hypothetical protein J6X86_04880 [Bacteroidales bacterium]|nr:hypothetical protein [Bacteroidales bacterium]